MAITYYGLDATQLVTVRVGPVETPSVAPGPSQKMSADEVQRTREQVAACRSPHVAVLVRLPTEDTEGFPSGVTVIGSEEPIWCDAMAASVDVEPAWMA